MHSCCMQTKVVVTTLVVCFLVGFPDAIRVSIAQNSIPVITPTVILTESENPDPLFAISEHSQNYEPVINAADILTPIYEKLLPSLVNSEESEPEQPQSYEPVRNPASIATVEFKLPNPSFAISVESVVKQLRDTQEKMILIDVRSKSEFEKFRIPGSINIPLFAIKTKTFLKSKSLLLVNEGYNPDQLEQECERLKKAGFNVRFLYGGFNAWKEQGYALDGDVFAQSGLNRMPAQSLFAEKENKHWIVIDISAPRDPQTSALIPQSMSIPYTTTHEETFMLVLEETLTPHENNPFISIVIVDEFGEQYDHIEKAVQNTDINNVFFLKGGLEGYKKFIDQQMLISQAKDNPKTLEACPCCP